MIGIYQDNIIDYLKENLSEPVKVTAKNIICRCPFCELNKTKKHYHMYISLEDPIFHCFHSDCQKRGFISKLFSKISGVDSFDKFVDKEKVKESEKKRKLENTIIEKEHNILIPDLNEDNFKLKTLYIKKRMKFHGTPISNVKGLVFDINKFIDVNEVTVDEKLFRIRDYLHSNFVGFLTEHKSIMILRNIDDNSTFKHFKMRVRNNKFLDYYKIGGNKNKNTFVLSEGIFDIMVEHINDKIGLKNEVHSYCAGLSTSYDALIKSLVFYDQVFRPNVVILSDRDVKLDYYKKIKMYNKHIINTLTVYYNKAGKDFAENVVVPDKFIVRN